MKCITLDLLEIKGKCKNICFFVMLSIVCSGAIQAQQSISTILQTVEQNNKDLLVIPEEYKAQNFLFKSNTSLANPTVDYDFLASPIGNQHEFILAQEFDVPQVYKKQQTLFEKYKSLQGLTYELHRQDIMVKTKSICYEIIYLNKLNQHNANLQRHLNQLLNNYQQKLKAGDGTILDVNKVKFQLLAIESEQSKQNIQREKSMSELAHLNGGVRIVISDTLYPEEEPISPYLSFEQDYLDKCIALKLYEQETEVSNAQLNLSKTKSYPKLELGYRFQGDDNTSYHGIHSGFSIPLWQQASIKKYHTSNVSVSKLKKELRFTQIQLEIVQQYAAYENYKKILKEYESVFASYNNLQHLSKALQLGEITSLQYLNELQQVQAVWQNYLEVEKLYNLTIAQLNKYLL